jgi:hyperosmotically inducible protein
MDTKMAKNQAIMLGLLLAGATVAYAGTMQDVGKAVDTSVQSVGSGLDNLAQSVGVVVNDSTITTSIKTQYVKDASIDAFDISVSTTDGVVTLSGNVPDAAIQKKAIDLAKATKGVKSVNSTALKVVPPAVAPVVNGNAKAQ